MIPVIAIFDIGKTNKKCFLFNEAYTVVWERTIQFAETADEEGFPCDAIQQIEQWMQRIIQEVFALKEYMVKAINFSAYGASFVYINEDGERVGGLSNYIKPYPSELQKKLFDDFGGEETVSLATASPVLGSLNSGMQLYRMKQEKPEIFQSIQYALHLPQYISYLISGKACSEITSIGCHTALWDFAKKQYHEWVYAEELDAKFSSLLRSDAVFEIIIDNHQLKAGIGLHDSSSALIPYLTCFSESFVLISTGTWCISLNPFNNEPLTPEELRQDCLCYLSYQRRPVKAARLFAGNEHEQYIQKMSSHFSVPIDTFKKIIFQTNLWLKIIEEQSAKTNTQAQSFEKRKLTDFVSYEEAYHQFIYTIIQQQKKSTSLVLSQHPPNQIFVDGGFANNPVFMQMLANVFPEYKVYAATVSQASALGAALVIHREWNTQRIPENLIALKYYSPVNNT